MNRNLSRLLLLTIASGAWTPNDNVQAGMITYSGNAEFFIPVSGSDPWGFVPPGSSTDTRLPMEISITITDSPSAVTTLSPHSIRPDLSSFVAGSITVDGTYIPIVGLTQIIFADGAYAGQYDLVRFRFDAAYSGVSLNLGIGFDMANTTFDLTGPTASPPTFAPSHTVYADYQSSSGGGAYQLRTYHSNTQNLSGAAVSAVPEPSSLMLLCSGITGLCGYGWRRRRANNDGTGL